MSDNPFFVLVGNAAILVSLVLFFDLVILRWRNDFWELRRVVSGLVLGGLTIAVMGFPWVYAPGVIIDGRTILLSISGLYFGITPTIIAMVLASSARFLIGGIGVLPGIATIIASGSIAIGWRYYRKKRIQAIGWLELYFIGLLVHLITVLLYFTLPDGMGLKLFVTVGPPVLVIYPLVFTLLGLMVVDHLSQYQTSQDLRQTQAQLELAFKASRTSFFSLDLESKEFIKSMEWPLLLGYQPGELKPDFSTWKEVAFPEDRDRILEQLDQFALSGEQIFETEFRARHKTEGTGWFLIRGKADQRKNGKVCSIVAVAVDITQVKQAEEEAKKAQLKLEKQLQLSNQSRKELANLLGRQRLAEEQIRQLNLTLERRVKERTAQLAAANDELEAFAYAVSHDLRAPLRGIDGFSAALENEISSQQTPKAWHYLQRIRQSTGTMSQLITDLLAFSRITWRDLERQPTNLSKLAVEITQRLQAEDGYGHIEVLIAPELWVEADPSLMQIVLENLLSNAFKFTSANPQGRVELCANPQNEKLVFCVRDNGVGFDMAYADRIFTPFQRMHHQDDFPGTGVGLATVKRIVGRHGGAIWAESTPGQGATFYFTLNTNSS